MKVKNYLILPVTLHPTIARFLHLSRNKLDINVLFMNKMKWADRKKQANKVADFDFAHHSNANSYNTSNMH